jgi:solute carrier family 35 protein F1/2
MTNVAAAGKNQLLGDMLCLGGAVLFAIVSVAQDLLVKTLHWVEYLGMVGLFGSILSIVQTYVLMWCPGADTDSIESQI